MSSITVDRFCFSFSHFYSINHSLSLPSPLPHTHRHAHTCTQTLTPVCKLFCISCDNNLYSHVSAFKLMSGLQPILITIEMVIQGWPGVSMYKARYGQNLSTIKPLLSWFKLFLKATNCIRFFYNLYSFIISIELQPTKPLYALQIVFEKLYHDRILPHFV